MDKDAIVRALAAGQQQPDIFVSPMAPGAWGTPAELYQNYQFSGMSSEQARQKILESLTSPTGSHEGWAKPDIEMDLQQKPMS